MLKGKQILLNKPIINATKEKIKQRLKDEESIEYYLQYHRDYFSFKPQDLECEQYKNLTQALNRLSDKKISLDGNNRYFIEKVRGGKGSWNYYTLPKEAIVRLINEVKEELENDTDL